MKELKHLIQECPEFGDIMADFENRISFLENSQSHCYRSEKEQPTPDVQPANKEVLSKLHKVEVLINDLRNILNKHIDKSKKKRMDKI